MLQSKIKFAGQLKNLKAKGVRLDKLAAIDDKIDAEIPVRNKEDYYKKQDLIKLESEKIMQESLAKHMLDYKKEKKQKQEMESYDEITQFIDTSIETNIMYFSPEFKEYVKQLESLQKALAQNEKILKKK